MQSLSHLIPDPMVQGYWPEISRSTLVQQIYQPWHNVDWQDTYFVLHLPAIGLYQNINIPTNVNRILLTCHVEPVDIEWLRELAVLRSDCEIYVLFDGLFAPPSEYYPSNVRLSPWLTWNFQLRGIFNTFGHRPRVPRPKFWASSLCNRSTQFKLYVTAHCVFKGYTDRMIISHHGIIDKASDVDHLRVGHTVLDHLADMIDSLPIMKIDCSLRQDRDLPNPANRDWNLPQHTECLFSFTNEGFHYSQKHTDHGTVIWPGPDLSEKTFKSLLAGQALLPVGQWRTLNALRQVGFQFDYGLNLEYDDIPGDIDRILACLTVIDNIMSSSLDDLYESTRESSSHNADWAVSGAFSQRCDTINADSLTKLCRWLGL